MPFGMRHSTSTGHCGVFPIGLHVQYVTCAGRPMGKSVFQPSQTRLVPIYRSLRDIRLAKSLEQGAHDSGRLFRLP